MIFLLVKIAQFSVNEVRVTLSLRCVINKTQS